MDLRRLSVPFVVVIGLSITTIAYLLALSWEEETFRSEFERRANNHAADLQTKVDLHIELLDSIAGLFESFESVERENFRNFVTPILQQYKEVQGYSWNPLVRLSQRSGIENLARRQGFEGFQFTELSEEGERRIAREREEYVTVFYLEPLTGNEQALGFDISSEVTRRKALIDARASSRAATTEWIRLVQEQEDQFGILVVRPVYLDGDQTTTLATVKRELLGYVVGVFRVGDMIEEALSPTLPAGLDFWIFQRSEPLYPSLGYYHPSRTRKNTSRAPGFAEIHKPEGDSLTLPLHLPGQEWSILYQTAPSFVADQDHYEAVGALTSGLILTIVLGIYLSAVKRDTLLTASLNEELKQKIVEHENSEDALRESESYNRMLFEKSTIGLVLSDVNGNLSDINNAFASILGRTVDETKQLNYWDITPSENAQIEKIQFDRLEQFSHYGPYEKHYFHKDGTLVSVRQTGRAIVRQGVKYIWSSVEDITDYKKARDRIEHMAFHDTLTNLPNRELLHDRLEHAIELSSRSKQLVGVLFLDIDRFKTINDSLGHRVGDQLLIQVAERLQHAVRRSDTVARFGGDEFIVVAEGITEHRQLEELAKTIIKNFAKPFSVGVHKLLTTTSIGITVSSAENMQAEGLITQADIAMYSAKDAGRNTYRFHAPEMGQLASEIASIERDLVGAMERDELLVYLQPITSFATGLPTGFEALMRWKHESRGMVGPDAFIPVMEASGMIVNASRWMLEQSCRLLKEFRTQTQKDLSIAVNLSAHCFYDPKIVDSIERALKSNDLAAHNLILEITESTLFSDPIGVRPAMERIKELGVQIALDDFGTGQSSLNHLRRFPIDIVKIDREFIRNIPDDTNDCELVSAIIAMAHKLNMKIVAEGVELESQLKFLQGLECDSVQGYLYSPPLTVENAMTYISQPTRFDMD